MKINFGYPETLHITGTALIIGGQNTIGYIFCGLGLIGLAMRFGIHVNEKEAQRRDLENVIDTVSHSASSFISKMVSNVKTNNAGMH